MVKKELCYRLEEIPDLTLNRYSSLENTGIEGVLEKHITFLRQWNRKGILSDVSIHLYYFFDGKDSMGNYSIGENGNKLEVLLVIRGNEDKLYNVPDLVAASALSDYFRFVECKYSNFLKRYKVESDVFSVCSTLIKREVFIYSSLETTKGEEGYYTVPQWEMNEDGRLFNMFKLMESLDKQILYRIDLYPVEKNEALRDAFRRPMLFLKERQSAKANTLGQRDYEAENVFRSYENLLENIETSPHFITNIFVFGDDIENTAVILDAAGSEALKKGNYEIATFKGKFNCNSFLEQNEYNNAYFDRKKKIILQKGSVGSIVCKEESQNYRLRYLPTLFTLEDIAPFFRFPTLYEGEVIQKRKETAPKQLSSEDSLYLGTDDNGYDVYFPLKNLAKHAFIAGVPGSGKTNTMHHLTSQLWKEHNIPFLVLEPAKQEYRALANQPGMENLHIFSPNADMLFPLHINPFEFPKGLMVAEHIRRLGEVFEGAFPLENPMPFLLDTAIEAVYRELGWTPETIYTDETKLKFPTMSMLYKRLEDELKITTYSDEIRGNLESALKVRIGSLLRREMGDVFDVAYSTIVPEDWLKIPAVIELESMGTGPANFLTLMLCALIREVLKVNPHHDKEYARHVIFIEEAHNLIGPEAEETSGSEANPKQAATAFLVKMLAEVRALKEGIIIADQLPTVMAQEVIKNTGLKIGLRITSADDRALLGSTMSANPLQMEEMAIFNIGRSLISYEGLMRPFTIQMHEWCGNWGTKHCNEKFLSKEWCEKKCSYYLSGDCIPDKEARQEVIVSKTDNDLVELVKNRNFYKKICERSFIIESTRFGMDFLNLSKSVEEIIEHNRKINEKDLEIKKLEAKVFEMSKELSSTSEWENNHEEMDKIYNMADYVNQLKEELKTKYKSSSKFKKTYSTIVECILFARRIQDKKKHWIKLGITQFKIINYGLVKDSQLSEIEVKVKCINDIQKNIILQAQELYIMASLHLSNPLKVRQILEEVVVMFKVKNILPTLDKEKKLWEEKSQD